MRILSTNFNQNPTNNNRYLPKKTFDTPQDTFISSNPSFKAGATGQGTKTLVDLGTVLAAGFAAYKALTGGNTELKNFNFDIKDFFKNIMGQQEELKDKIQRLEEENTRLKQENSELKANQGENNNSTTEAPVLATKTDSEDYANKTEDFVKFPPKRGVLSNEQKVLKNTVTKISISPEYNEKLTAICQDILKKGSKDPENKTRTLNVASELEACGNDTEKLKSVIDKYEIKEKSSEEFSTDGTVEQDDTEGNNGTADTGVKLPGPKIIGTLDLNQVQDTRKKRPRISQSATNSSTVQSAKGDDGSKQTQAKANPSFVTMIPSKEVSGTYTFSLPGTVHLGTKANLSNALVHFERQYLTDKKEEAKQNGIQAEYIQWMFRRPVGQVKEDDVVNEVSKCKTHGTRSKYNNINSMNAAEVAAAINEEPRFKEMFNFHGSTKFIERFVDFNSEELIGDQVHHVMDVLESTIQHAIKHGVDMEEHDDVFIYKDKNNKEIVEVHKGTNITIPTEYYTEEARKIFGSYPLKIGICRSGKMERQAIICTIYPKGVY